MKRSGDGGIICAMKDWKTYAIIALALWCAYLTWRVSPAIVWQAHNFQNHHRDRNVYLWLGHPPVEVPRSEYSPPRQVHHSRLLDAKGQ